MMHLWGTFTALIFCGGLLSLLQPSYAQPGVDENIIIDILQPLPPWGGTYRMWDNTAEPTKSITFICSQSCTFLRVTEEAFNTCDVTSGGAAATGNAAISCSPGDSPIINMPSFGRTPGVYYWISLTNGTGSRSDFPSEPGQGGACSLGAKARVDIMAKTPANEALYNCTGITCASTRLCHTLECGWGQCMDEARAESMPDGTACDDDNPLTPNDECGNGFCAGVDDYWFTVLLNVTGTSPFSTGALSVSQVEAIARNIANCSGVSGFTYYSDDVASTLTTVNFSLPSFREFGTNALDDGLLRCVGTSLTFRSRSCTVASIPFVSATQTPAPTQAPTTATPTDTPTTSAPTPMPSERPTRLPTVTGGTFHPTTASPTRLGETRAPTSQAPTTLASVQSSGSNDNNKESFTSSLYFYAAAGGLGLVLIVMLLCCCCCRKKRDQKNSPMDPRRNTTSDGRVPMHENPMFGPKKTPPAASTADPTIEGGGSERLSFHMGRTTASADDDVGPAAPPPPLPTGPSAPPPPLPTSAPPAEGSTVALTEAKQIDANYIDVDKIAAASPTANYIETQ